MIFRAIEKAHDAVEDVAIEAAYGIAAILLTCCAYIFAAVGVVLWLATMMPLYAALLIVAIFTVICAAIVYLIGQRPQSEPKEEEEAPTGSSQLTSLAKSFSSMGAPLDLVASGLLARQMKKAPIATIAATAALGAFISVMANSDDGEG
ncbi:phage holin family protein [Hyphococcus sp. DH-69]|uniref:phage holin family protein n=1 Tax=Hyphococcus formosus TaxID=3143534 RepID=UPI00398A8E24